MMIDNTFQAAHDWQHKVGKDRYPKGEHMIASCSCGVEVFGISTGGHGKFDKIETRNGESDYCVKSGRDHRQNKWSGKVKKF